MNKAYKKTMYACFTGYIVQAIVNNFTPLLFVYFQSVFGLSIAKITFLVTFNFLLQLFIDLISPAILRVLSYRTAIVFAHLCSSLGLCLLAVLPGVCKDPFVGFLIAVAVYAVGGGLIEVLISPVVEALPNENKKGMMSLLHSFYCWGQMGVVLLSTLFFVTAGIENYRILAFLFAVIPFVNALVFLKVPILTLLHEGEKGMSLKELFRSRTFYALLLLMVCAGGSELAVSQWASAIAEQSLHLSKTVGDLLGITLFAALMGTARILYVRMKRLSIETAMFLCGILCFFSYLLIALSPFPILSLLGCGICGFSVGLFWPGTYSLAAEKLPRGGTTMFAFLALFGDAGCSSGPTVVGFVSGLFDDNLRFGILTAGIIPLLLLVGLYLLQKEKKKKAGKMYEGEGDNKVLK